ncbi:hypothetical protein PTUN_b0027 [Pseudoalteromonas tunicata]|uniref:Uncharacterized protein n=1 Tax=Pseudoalteromonas tunicata D2 TaxID=87626 RepID=A4C3T8_9GAMM|nr:hypothetical protein PTUN_b0027 [Pseudoalteromonas tunicata]EAR30220.1 hypothetical protein PTD2_01586 [Pseudoalteromonas tunicata D2]
MRADTFCFIFSQLIVFCTSYKVGGIIITLFIALSEFYFGLKVCDVFLVS